MSKRAKLKPCPFCGHERINKFGMNIWFWNVCDNCVATTRGAKTRRQANKNWNTRAK